MDQINEKDSEALQFPMEPTDAMFYLLFQFPVGDGSAEYAVATDGYLIYTSSWNAPGNFFEYEMNGTFIGSFTIAGASSIRDLTYDGTYFYGAPNTTNIYQMDFTNQTLIGTITALAAVCAIAYDAVAYAFWVSNGWNPPLRLISRTGTAQLFFKKNIANSQSISLKVL